MGLFDRIKTTAAGVGASIAKGAGQLTGKATVEAKEAAKIAAVKADIAAVQAEIDTGYVQIGKAYVDACIAGKEVSGIRLMKQGAKGSEAGWGRLKSGAGFIALDYAKRV